MSALQRGIGRLIQFGLSKEDARGTDPGSVDFWVPWEDLSFGEKVDRVLDEQARGVIEDSQSMTARKRTAEGVLKAPMTDASFGLLLLAIFGADSPAPNGTDATVTDHAITVAQSAQHQTLTYYKHDPIPTPSGASADYSYANGAVAKLELDCSLDKFAMYAATIRAQGGTVQGSPLSPSGGSENRFVKPHISFKFANNLSGLAGASATPVKSLKLTIDQNLEDYDVFGQLSPADFLNKKFSIDGTFEAIWENEADFFIPFIETTPVALEIAFENKDVTIGGANTVHPKIIFRFAKCYLELTKDPKLNDLLFQTVKFKAVYSPDDGEMADAKVSNLVAAY